MLLELQRYACRHWPVAVYGWKRKVILLSSTLTHSQCDTEFVSSAIVVCATRLLVFCQQQVCFVDNIAQRPKDRSHQRCLHIVAIFISSRDICAQTRKLS